MSRRIQWILALLVAVGSGAAAWFFRFDLEPAPPDREEIPAESPEPGKEELEVYSFLCEQGNYTGAKVLFIEEETQPQGLTESAVPAEWGRGIDEALQDFLRKSSEGGRIRSFSKASKPVVLLGPGKVKWLFRDNSGWKRFYHLYPQAEGIITFSRVGFDKTMNVAIVAAGRATNYLGGGGRAFILRRVDGRWTKDDTVFAWTN
jgi:hypothetical protein